MKNKPYRYLLSFVFAVGLFGSLYAQPTTGGKKETKEEYMSRMQNMVDSIKRTKQETKNSNNAAGNMSQPRMSSAKYSTKKSLIDNTYKQLTSAEKEKVKNFPVVPEAFRNNIDAQDFLNKLQGIDLNAAISKHTGEKSMALVGYYISYQSVKQKAEAIVKEAAKLKADFNKLNPNINFGANVGKTYISENGLVYLPLGDASFVDEVVNAKYISGNIKFPPENCIGTPNYVEEKKLENNKGIYSLGAKGVLTVTFTNNALVDVNGPDLFVFEAGEIESTNLEISKDGLTWIKVGSISGGTAAVDISKVVKPNEYYYYVRLTDLDKKSTIAGADIDAIASIGAAMKLSLNAEVLFDFGKASLKPEGIAAVKKLALQLQTMPTAQLNIDGYTDDIGTDDANNKLSLQRAQAVVVILKEALKSRPGYTYREAGKGKASPVVPNINEENRKKNRRVEIVVVPK